TTTLMGRRRYLPELQARNPRVRSLGERMALNAPIQGTAADIIKLAMVRADQVLSGAPHGKTSKKAKLSSRMVLTVHDELVFEVLEGSAEEVGKQVREAMEHAIELIVPLKVDLSWGKNWTDAKS
ncbi:MAG: DNA polymerase, partial [Acidimicrobiia bacterium]